ncbi:MAG: hypothetical protein GEU90_21560 [Gemmatimonas sp.]|nr:hypothetical protein [Gemmatimonas sp.]
MSTRAEPKEPAEPIPEEWISEKPGPEEAAEWWERWRNLPSIERRRPAAEVLAEVRGEERDDVNE